MVYSGGGRKETFSQAQWSGRGDDPFGRAPKNLSHYLGALRSDQRILADEESRHAADPALTRR
jgi:hypothetical protein